MFNNKKLEETVKNVGRITKTNEELISKVFNAIPENKDFLSVIYKILLVDYTYSTQLHIHRKKTHINKIAENIIACGNFDELVKSGDSKAVLEILQGLDVNLFSFATKYCHLHNYHIYNRDDYSIYDSSVRKALPKCANSVFGKGNHNVTYKNIEKWRKEKDYKSFNDFIEILLEKAEITVQYRRRKFDKFIWNQRNG